jgi:hypothetical protein
LSHDGPAQGAERRKYLTTKVSAARLRHLLDAAEQHWFIGRLRAGVVPGQIARRHRTYRRAQRAREAAQRREVGRERAVSIVCTAPF